MHKKLSLLMLLSLILAILCANFFPSLVIKSKFLGKYFIELLKAFVPFLIFGTITYSIASFDAFSNVKKIVPLTLILYIASTLIAITFALIVGSFLDFGVENKYIPNPEDLVSAQVDIGSSLSVLAIDFSNFFNLITEANPFAIMILSLILGVSVRFTAKYNQKIVGILSNINSLVINITNYIMLLAPLAIFSLFANLLIEVEGETIYSLLRFVISSILIFITYMFVFYGAIVKYLAGISPYYFFSKIKNTLIFAFFSSSSAATMPLTLKTAEDELKINKEVSSFVIPIGVTVNMDGSAIYLGLAALFVAQILGIEFTFNEYLVICLTATIGSIGAAGVPSVALVMMTIVFSSVGIPLEAIAIIAGVDRLLDMFRTSINVAGDLTIASIINKFIK
ncbi:dicarboxylate/amino acid:cation symporter [bacterium]|jgi:Na+/H+-dicarboxylate symporter|nr:dicarboxylate/amino acid:cation symporter [bacterium]MBT3795368.1 dicarboxylate/amino acid:cation symporter [bacterium]MBT4634248.1 dicarboxylate/amino acid:cation symporter [bacterium]